MRKDCTILTSTADSATRCPALSLHGRRSSRNRQLLQRVAQSDGVILDVPAELRSILNLEVPLIVIIAQRDMPLREVMNLAPGAILELPKGAHDDLEVMVNNMPIGAGCAVKVGENFGVRMTYVGDLQERIEAMGKNKPAVESEDEPANAPAKSPMLATPA